VKTELITKSFSGINIEKYIIYTVDVCVIGVIICS